MLAIWQSGQDRKAVHYFYNNLRQSFTFEQVIYEESISPKNWLDLNDFDEIWDYLSGPMLDTLYPDDEALMSYYEGENMSTRGFGYIRGQARVLNFPRLRQVRSRISPCSDSFGRATMCLEPYTKREETKSFGPNSEFVYQSPSTLGGTFIWGNLGIFYAGGGFVETLPSYDTDDINPRAAAIAQLENLRNKSWIDTQTRALFIEVPVYNGNEELFGWVNLIAEISPTGAVLCSDHISVERFIRTFTDVDKITLVLEIIVAIGMAWLVCEHGVRIASLGWKYFKKPPNWITIILFLSYVARAIIIFVGLSIESDIAWDSTDTFVNLEPLALNWSVERSLFGVFVWVSWINLIWYTSAFDDMARVLLIIRFVIPELFPFLGVFLLWILGFSITTHVSYGYQFEDYRNFESSAVSRFRDSFLGPDFDRAIGVSRFSGAIVEILFSVLFILILLNLLIAVMNAQYEHAQSETGGIEWTKNKFRQIRYFERYRRAYNRVLPCLQKTS